MAYVDPQRDKLRDALWTREGEGFVTPSQGMSLVSIPYDLPAAYVLTLTAERRAGGHWLMLAPVCGDKRVHVLLDLGWGTNDAPS